MHMKNILFIAVMAALACRGLPASAHAFPDHSDPAVGGTVATAPAQVRIWFTEALEPTFSTMTVTDTKGDSVGQGKANVDKTDPKLLELGLKPVPPGTYRVKWRVISVDTHQTQGDFTFTVKP